jgi:hypothetical protein
MAAFGWHPSERVDFLRKTYVSTGSSRRGIELNRQTWLNKLPIEVEMPRNVKTGDRLVTFLEGQILRGS